MDQKQKHRWLLIFGGISIFLLSAVFGFQTYVDPFGVWGAPSVSGMNNSRVAQVHTDRMFKPYQLVRKAPEVVFLGTSHVEYGLPPRWSGVDPEKIYNFGIGTLNVGEAQAYAGFLAALPSVRVVAIEVDPVFFSGNFNKEYPGFSKDRLRALSQSRLLGGLEKLKDTVFNFDAVLQSIETIEASREKPEHRFYDDYGWFVHRGEVEGPLSSSYRGLMWNYADGYYRARPRPRQAFTIFEAMIKTLKQRGIEVVLFTSPLSVDLQMIIDAQGLTDFVDAIKRKSAAIAPLWDFGGVNSVTRNLRNYSDGSHYLGTIGARMTDRMSAKTRPAGQSTSEDFGVLLTKNNIEAHLQKNREALEQYKADNPDIYNAFQAADRDGNKAGFQSSTRRRYSF